MARDKLLERMKNNPRGDWQISHVETLAKRYGFSISRPRRGSSHVTLRHDLTEKLTIPAHRPIKPVYIRQLVQMVEKIIDQQEEY